MPRVHRRRVDWESPTEHRIDRMSRNLYPDFLGRCGDFRFVRFPAWLSGVRLLG